MEGRLNESVIGIGHVCTDMTGLDHTVTFKVHSLLLLCRSICAPKCRDLMNLAIEDLVPYLQLYYSVPCQAKASIEFICLFYIGLDPECRCRILCTQVLRNLKLCKQNQIVQA